MKVTDLDVLARLVREAQAAGSRVVHYHGEFNLVGEAHLRFLTEAKAMGDVLVVTVIHDRDLGRPASIGPAIPQDLRAQWVAALPMVDHVAVDTGASVAEAIRRLRPDVHVMAAGERGPAIEAARSAAEEVLSEVRLTRASLDHTVAQRPMTPPEAHGFLESIRERYTARGIREYLDRLSGLRVLAIGETILDEYVYCDALGKSGKEPVLAMRYLSREMFPGGILAICNHLVEMCAEVDLLTYLGATHTHEEFVRKGLKPGIHPHFFYKPGSPTVVKRRYVESYSLAKLFGVYRINDEPLAEAEEDQVCRELKDRLPEADVVIVADYGHGLITPRMADLLIERSRFLAVNTQINAANIGFHTISKYRRADYVCIQEGELRHDSRSRDEDVRHLVSALARRLSCRAVMTTRGRYGTLLYGEDEGFSECPAFAVKIVDRIGAGDALLAVTSLCVAAGLPAEVTGLLGNLAGAEAVATVGHKSSIDRASLVRRLEQLLD